jgi:hypothetical protein
MGYRLERRIGSTWYRLEWRKDICHDLLKRLGVDRSVWSEFRMAAFKSG